jgi:hypothetical protein
VLDGGIADAGILLWVSRAWADDQLCGVGRNQLLDGDFVVAEDGDVGAFEHEVLVDIPGEGVVVVDEDQVRGGRNRRRRGRVLGRVVDEGKCGRHGGGSVVWWWWGRSRGGNWETTDGGVQAALV